MAERSHVPPARNVTLPRPDLSAREALAIVEPFTVEFKAPWHLASLCGQGSFQKDGRNHPEAGMWRFSYRKGVSGNVVHVGLYPRGFISFRGESMPTFTLSNLPMAVPLPEEWLDSTEIAAIVARCPVPEGLGESSIGMMSLTPQTEFPLCWNVYRTAATRESDFASWTLVMDAKDGRMIFEDVGCRFKHHVIPARRRFAGALWEDVPPPDGVSAAEDGRAKR